jgi:hypothetical protein
LGLEWPAITRKVKVMFRKMAIALVAASVFTAPVLAQNPPLSGGTTSPSGETTEKAKQPEKTEKAAESTEKVEKKVMQHHRIARHHRHGTKAAKVGKHPSAKTAKYAKIEVRRTKHGRTTSKHVYGKASKRMPSGTTAH